MAKYRITSPSGEVFEITAPDSATMEEVRAYAQQNYQPRAAAPAPKGPDPSEGGSTLQVWNPARMVNDNAKNFDTGIPVGQGVNRLLAGIGSGLSDLSTGVQQRLGLVDQASVDEKRGLDAPLKETAAGTIGNVVGRIAGTAPAALVPGANTLLGAAAIGAGQGVLEPTATGESVLKNAAIGGATGAGGVMLGRAIAAGAKGVKALVEPFTAAGQERIAGRTIQRFAADPQALAGASGARTATGALPTLAESTRDTGLAALERSLSQQDPRIAAQFAQRAADNNAARVNLVAQIAGDPAKRAAAEEARRAAAGEMYRAATNATYTVDGELANLLQRPAIKQAMQRAQTLAENEGRRFSFNVTPSNEFSGIGVQRASSQQITGQGLQDLKNALDEMLTDPASGFAGKAGNAVKGLRGQIVDWMERANPDFKAARQSYAELSRPLNAMDVGQRLLDKTTGAIRDLGGNQRLQANAFARALNDEQSLVRNATGFRGVNSLADVMTPQQMAQLGAVRGELELASNLASAANGPGSQTAKSLASQNILRQMLGPTGMPQSWAESAMLETLLRPLQFTMQAAEPRIQSRIAQIMLDPSQAAPALAAAAPRQVQLGPVARRFLEVGEVSGKQVLPVLAVSDR